MGIGLIQTARSEFSQRSRFGRFFDLARHEEEECETGAVDFDVAFQPIFDMKTRQVHAYEALVRGQSGETAYSVLNRVDDAHRAHFEQCVRIAAINKAARLGLGKIGALLSINVTPGNMLEVIRPLHETRTEAERLGIDPTRIIFEITENMRVDPRQASAMVLAYRSYGFKTALDDFGAGYAGLVTLAELPTDFVKIDMALIRSIDSNEHRRRIVAGVVAMLRSLGREVVAEGVETARELETITDIGITLIQGFFLGRPSRNELQRSPAMSLVQ